MHGGEHYKTFIRLFKESYDEGLIEERINDAVRRILGLNFVQLRRTQWLIEVS